MLNLSFSLSAQAAIATPASVGIPAGGLEWSIDALTWGVGNTLTWG